MPKATEGIVNFLRAKRDKRAHEGPDLIDRFLKYGCDMEVQVNVAAGKGEPVQGKRSTFSDGIDQWFNFRIPKNADSEPEFHDFELRFPLDLHCEGIGSTGWDWKARRSRWVGFDFDSIVGHAAGVGVTVDELDKVREKAKNLPYVEVRNSTGGAGLHLYVIFDDHEAFNTKNHTEHAALARAVLGVMSLDAGFDFKDQIDACGGNMWLWHRKSTGTVGLKLIKEATVFKAEQLPNNWEINIPVIKGTRRKVRLSREDAPETEEDIYNELASAHRQVKLDEKHNAMIAEIKRLGFRCDWISDHHCIQTHTMGFKKLYERKDEFGIQGVFDTNSKGTDPMTANCFAFPLDNGGWKIYRFGVGGRITEAPTWEQDSLGRMTCWFNVRPNLDMAARAKGGKKMDRGGYEFDSLEKAVEVAKMLKPNFELEIEEHMKKRTAVVRRSKDGQVAIEIPKTGNGEAPPKGDWNSSDKKSAWTQVFDIVAQPEKLEVSDYDNLIRCLETSDGQTAGWATKKADGEWTRKPSGEIKMILQDMGHPKPEAEQIMGRYARNPWKLVTLPFQPEYPRGRCWNLDAPQYRFQPAPRMDSSNGAEGGEDSRHPHWDMILDHVGGDLTMYIKELDWAAAYGIRTGADYLRANYASILREPYEPTPYLFLFGPENSGKSIYHEAFELLVTSGVVKADRSLTSQSDFNGEMAGAIMCVVEEKDISKTPGAYAKIKDAVTSRRLSIRRMRMDSYMIDNMTHWVQCANFQDACPVFEGDTRITMIYVPPLPPGREIPKSVLLARLKEEAPHFMRTLMDMPLPPLTGRLRIPVISTQYKKQSERLNRTALENFIRENLHEAPGQLILFSDFYTRFVEQLAIDEKGAWSRVKVSRSLPLKFQSGQGTGNKTYIINASWEPVQPDPNAKPYYISNDRIKRVE
jgi:hypothetical protein